MAVGTIPKPTTLQSPNKVGRLLDQVKQLLNYAQFLFTIFVFLRYGRGVKNKFCIIVIIDEYINRRGKEERD